MGVVDIFDESVAGKDPFEQFAAWYSEIEKTGRENYNAVALSTATGDGSVSSRIVLLKEHGPDGFIFFSNYNSRKGMQIENNPAAALLFYWPDFRRQVRVEGVIGKTGAEESDRYFDSRIPGHKLNAHASPQSEIISSREVLLDKLAALTARYPDSDPPRPLHWGGYRLVPNMFEFWQEGRMRFHDRLQYSTTSKGWVINRLAP